MTGLERDQAERATFASRMFLYYGWINVFMAAITMTATLPGRTHGLGLITEKLLADLQLERTLYSQINLVSSLLGALFCLPIGFLIDRWGTRFVQTFVLVSLGASVLWMARVNDATSLCIALILIRGLGQSALSIVSMALIGKWFQRRLGTAMGVYAVLLTFGFIGSILGMGWAVEQYGWRSAWNGLGVSLLAYAPIGWLIVRSTPQSAGVNDRIESILAPQTDTPVTTRDFSLMEALKLPAFWVIVLGTSAFNLVWSSVMLFNEDILKERGFADDVAVKIMAGLTGFGLLANLVCGAVATRQRTGKLLGIGLGILAVGLAFFPTIESMSAIWAYATAIGVAGGIVTVVFFAAWGNVFGRAHLGRIQGAAQLVSVLASAVGPVLMAVCKQMANSYLPMFYVLAALTGLLAVAAMIVPIPEFDQKSESDAFESIPMNAALRVAQE